MGSSVQITVRRGSEELDAVLIREDLTKVTEAKNLFLALAELKGACERSTLPPLGMCGREEGGVGDRADRQGRVGRRWRKGEE